MTRTIINSRNRIIIERDRSPIHEQRGWKYSGSKYKGFYKTKFGNFEGEAKKRFTGDYKFFIFNPPRELENHPHWVCFVHQSGDKFWVHFNKSVYDLDTGIIQIESILCDACENYY